jgi:hypothetical protein
MATYHLYPQEMLRKFEFFPIKCRIQRAAEVFREIREELLAPVGMNYPDANSGNKELPPIKSKVYLLQLGKLFGLHDDIGFESCKL